MKTREYNMGSVILAIVLSTVSTNAFASGYAANQTISKMMMDENYGEKIFIKMSGSVTNTTSCSTHPNWDFVLDTSTPLGIQVYAVLLNVYNNESLVTITGVGTCSVFSGIDTLRRIETL